MGAGVKAGIVVVALGALGWLGWTFLGPKPPDEVRATDESTEATPEEASAALLSGRPRAPAAAEAPAATYAIRGIVVDEKKQPVAGVRVTAVRTGPAWDSDDPGSWEYVSARDSQQKAFASFDAPKSGEPKADAAATSGADGTFSLAVRETGGFSIRARPEPPRYGTTQYVSIVKRTTLREVSLQVLDGSVLKGRVLEADGRPVGAVVTGRWDASSAAQGWSTDPTATDPASGEFTWPAVPAGKAMVSVAVPGRLSISGFELTTPRNDVFEIRLGDGGVVRGRAADTQGHAVAGADVMVWTSAGSTGGQGRAKTAPDGTYRVEGLPPGRGTSLSAIAAEYPLPQQPPPQAPGGA